MEQSIYNLGNNKKPLEKNDPLGVYSDDDHNFNKPGTVIIEKNINIQQ